MTDTTDLLWSPADGWADLTAPVLDRLRAGATVGWLSYSGTATELRLNDRGEVCRLRLPRSGHINVHAFDGHWLVAAGWGATACGAWEDSGYRSSPPRAVVALQPRGEPVDLGLVVVDVPAAWTPLPGHPAEPCPAHYCQAAGA